MSESWIDYGYGVQMSQIKICDVERVKALIDLAPTFKAKINAFFEEERIEPSLNDYEDYDQDYYHGFAFILKSVIEEAEGIELLSCDDMNGEVYLMYPPLYPWQMREPDYGVTSDKLDDIYKKYIGIISDSPVEPEIQESHQFG